MVCAAASANLIGFVTGVLAGGVLGFGVLAYVFDGHVQEEIALRRLQRPRTHDDLERSATLEQRLRWATPIYLIFLIWSSGGVAAGLAMRSVLVTVVAATSVVVAMVAVIRFRTLSQDLHPPERNEVQQP